MKTSMILLHEIFLINDHKSSSNREEIEEEIHIWNLGTKYDYVGIFKYAYTHHKTHPTFIYKWIHVIFLIFIHSKYQNKCIGKKCLNLYLIIKKVLVHGYGVAEYGKYWTEMKEKRVKWMTFWRPNNPL